MTSGNTRSRRRDGVRKTTALKQFSLIWDVQGLDSLRFSKTPLSDLLMAVQSCLSN